MGGSVTGAIGIAYGDNAFFSDGNGNPLVPPGSLMNPDPVVGTVNTYQANGTWVNCATRISPASPRSNIISHRFTITSVQTARQMPTTLRATPMFPTTLLARSRRSSRRRWHR